MPFSPCPFIKEKENLKLRISLSAGSLDDFPVDLQTPKDFKILN